MLNTFIENKFKIKLVDKDILNIGLLNSGEEQLLTYIVDDKYMSQLKQKNNIAFVITNKELAKEIRDEKYYSYVSKDPTLDFFELYNEIGKASHTLYENSIHPSSKISPHAFISENNVLIGKNVIIEPNVTIFGDVKIGDNCIIKSGAVIGSDDVEAKLTSKGLINAFHDGNVIIGDNVTVGVNTNIVKGIYGDDTRIGNGTIISNNCHIGHRAVIGRNCLILVCTICGGAEIGDNVRVSPGAVISNQVSVGNSANIRIGAIVIKNVKPNATVSGNFSLDHNRFLFRHIKTYGKL